MFNDLRDAALLSLRGAVGRELAGVLRASAESCARRFGELEAAAPKDERVQLLGMVRAMNKALLPFLASALQARAPLPARVLCAAAAEVRAAGGV